MQSIYLFMQALRDVRHGEKTGKSQPEGKLDHTENCVSVLDVTYPGDISVLVLRLAN